MSCPLCRDLPQAGQVGILHNALACLEEGGGGGSFPLNLLRTGGSKALTTSSNSSSTLLVEKRTAFSSIRWGFSSSYITSFSGSAAPEAHVHLIITSLVRLGFCRKQPGQFRSSIRILECSCFQFFSLLATAHQRCHALGTSLSYHSPTSASPWSSVAGSGEGFAYSPSPLCPSHLSWQRLEAPSPQLPEASAHCLQGCQGSLGFLSSWRAHNTSSDNAAGQAAWQLAWPLTYGTCATHHEQTVLQPQRSTFSLGPHEDSEILEARGAHIAAHITSSFVPMGIKRNHARWLRGEHAIVIRVTTATKAPATLLAEM